MFFVFCVDVLCANMVSVLACLFRFLSVYSPTHVSITDTNHTQASNKLIDAMANQTDPFNSPQNEWSQGPGGGGCCTMM
jgi:hypothetical protein